MAAWSAFFPWVKPSVPGCPDLAIERAICDAAIEFCEFTQAFVQTSTLKIRANVATYDLSTNSGIPGMALGASGNNGRPITPTYLEALMNARGEAWRNDTGDPINYVADSEDALRLYPIPTKDETGLITLAVRPSRSDTSWDDRLFERYAEIIADGALARLFDQANVNWSDGTLAAVKRAKFQRGMNKVRAKVLTAFTPATLYAELDGARP